MNGGRGSVDAWHLAWRVLFGGFLLAALAVGLWLSLRPGVFATSARDVLEQRRSESERASEQAPSTTAEVTEAGGPTRQERQAARERRRQRDRRLIAAAPDPQETSVQVLDAAGDTAAVDAVIERLTEFGYNVVATNPSRQDYDATTVLYTDGHEDEAVALRARDRRFAEIEINDRLSPSVDLHVIVGSDLAG